MWKCVRSTRLALAYPVGKISGSRYCSWSNPHLFILRYALYTILRALRRPPSAILTLNPTGDVSLLALT